MQPDHYRNLPLGFDLSTYEIHSSNVTRRLKHLELIDIGGRELIIHHTPGETPGAICLQDNLYNILFTGDTFLIGGSIWAHLEESDFDLYLSSLNYLNRLLDHISYICPAHNEIWVPKEFLNIVLGAFEEIKKGGIKPKIVGNKHIYSFNEFNVITRVIGKKYEYK
jgi:glyoxylase-like metal-dependent hydrolase (beta-lactamase superfamily II)